MSTRKMKDSGVEWIGQIPDKWRIVPARCLFDEETEKNTQLKYSRQFSFRYGQIVDKSVNTVAIEAVGETIAAYRVVKPDTIMINGLNLNYDFISQRVAIVRELGVITSAYLAVKSRAQLLPDYALYLFKGYDSRQVFHGYGNGIRKTLSFGDFKEIPVVWPTMEEQYAIAAYLDDRCAKIDALVESAKKSIEEYKALKASIIFETVTGKNAGGKMKDSGVEWIEQIPVNWNVFPLKKCFSYSKGLNITKADLTEDGVPVISYGQIHSKTNPGTHLSDDLLRHVPDNYLIDNPESKLTRDDFVFADTSEDLEGLGNCVFVDRDDPVMGGYHTIILRPIINANLKYVAYLFKSDCWRKQLRESASGIKVFSLSQRMLNRCSIILPPIPEQEKISRILDNKCRVIDQLVHEKEALIADLEVYKKSLIFECVTGKREVA